MNSKLVIALIAVITMITMYIKQTTAPDLIENWDGNWSVRAQNQTPSCYGGQTDIPGNYTSPGFFTVPGTYQNSLTTRSCQPMGYGAAIRYDTPELAHMASGSRRRYRSKFQVWLSTKVYQL